MNYKLLFICLILPLSVYKNKVSKSTALLKSVNLEYENFDTFFKKIQTIPDFQVSRIEFPLKNVTESDEGKTTKFITKDKWKYTNFLKIKKLTTSKTLITKTDMEVLFAIRDTGVHVMYHFKNEKSLWRLVLIVDESD